MGDGQCGDGRAKMDSSVHKQQHKMGDRKMSMCVEGMKH